MSASVAATERGEAPAWSVSMATGACIPGPLAVRPCKADCCLVELEALPRVKDAARVSSNADLQVDQRKR